MSGSSLIKLQVLRTATLLKRDFCKTCEIFSNTLFYWTSSVAASDNLKKIFCEICKISKNIFWQNTSGWLLLKFICEFWEVFQNTSFIEHLWETAHFMYKLQYSNQQIQWKTVSQVLFKHFIQEREVTIRRNSFTKIYENYLWRR